MPNNPLFISFFTTDYRPCALMLQKKLKEFGKKFWVKEVKDTGSWKKNIRRKPGIIHDMMCKAPQHDCIVWLDADSIVLQSPDLFDTLTEDVAFYFYERKAAEDKEPLAGTMFFRNTRKVREFVRVWAKKVGRAPIHMKRPDQQYMREMLPKSGLSVYQLPYSYSRLWTDKKQKGGVIRHQRWSMRFEHQKMTETEKQEKRMRHIELADERAKRKAEKEGRAWYPLHEAKLLGKEEVRKVKQRMAKETQKRKELRESIRRAKYMERRKNMG